MRPEHLVQIRILSLTTLNGNRPKPLVNAWLDMHTRLEDLVAYDLSS